MFYLQVHVMFYLYEENIPGVTHKTFPPSLVIICNKTYDIYLFIISILS